MRQVLTLCEPTEAASQASVNQASGWNGVAAPTGEAGA